MHTHLTRNFLIIAHMYVSLVCAQELSLSEKNTLDDIVSHYTFVGDLRVKEAEREPMKSMFFWRYPMSVPKIHFPVFYDLGVGPDELEAMPGHGRPVEHMNKGRTYFKQGDFEEAKKVWLSARARFGTEYEGHRRNDYFAATSFLNIARKVLEKDPESYEIKMHDVNAATFLSWAFIRKQDISDAFLDKMTPKGLLTLASIYYAYNRFGGAFGAAETGLNFLRKTGRSDFRTPLRRMLVETYIRSGEYLKSMQELDLLIRQETSAKEIASAFARVADIYFDLNNYELAEHTYALSRRVSGLLHEWDGVSLMLHGESLFWLSRFKEAQTALSLGIESTLNQKGLQTHHASLVSWASLRYGDTFLALYEQEQDVASKATWIAQAKLSYFRTSQQFPNTEAAKTASVRLACLELPVYQGNNVLHARTMLAEKRQEDMPLTVIELAGYCEVLSYVHQDQSPAMIERIKNYAQEFPQSSFLKAFVKPIQKIRENDLKGYLSAGEFQTSVTFYETYKEVFFKDLTSDTRSGLFRAYVERFQSDKAKEFYADFKALSKTSAPKASAMDLLREAVYLQETAQNAQAQNLNFLKQASWSAEDLIPRNVLIRRLLHADPVGSYLGWIFSLRWQESAEDMDKVCDEVYPILSAMVAKPDLFRPSEFYSFFDAIESKLPRYLKLRHSCAEDLLELESKVYVDAPDMYTKKWLTRFVWPIDKTIASYLWVTAEQCLTLKHISEARAIYEHLVLKAPKKLLESQMAKLRLEKFRTEVQDLWESPR